MQSFALLFLPLLYAVDVFINALCQKPYFGGYARDILGKFVNTRRKLAKLADSLMRDFYAFAYLRNFARYPALLHPTVII